MKRAFTWTTFLFLSVFLTAQLYVAQQQPSPAAPPAAATLGLDQKVPVEPAITVGTLPNGLRYYIRANKQPLNRAELRLVVKAGSILEEDDQQGLAHFVEHMGFNGTKNFPGEEVVKFLQSTGMRFGADVNASTSFDETIYMLTVPTDKPDILEKSFLVLEDWAHNVTFDPAEVEKERAVIMEEWRLRRGAGARTSDKLFPLLLEGSRYADRIPIGKTDVIQNFKVERLKQFYTDWYRPDLMAVVAVGDFDKAAIETAIKAHFGSIPAAPRTARERKVYDIPDHDGALFAILADKETTTTSVEMDNLLPRSPQETVGAYRQHIVDDLFSSMISARFSEITQKPGAPFVAAFAGRGQFIAKTKDTAALQAVVKDGGVAAGMEALLAEAKRVERFGFTATELEREKQGTLRSYERMLTQKETRTSASHAAEQIRNFLSGEALPGADLEYALHQRFLPQITLAEVNALSKEWFGGVNNRLVIVTGPDKEGFPLPTESQLTTLIKNAGDKPLTAYVDTAGSQALMDTLPTPGTITKTSTREPGITEWELSNGVKVVLKPTDFKPDEIVFQAFSPGGSSLVSDADYPAVSSATGAVTAGGLGKFNAIDLRKALTGKVASASPSIGELQEGMGGSASKKDLETMFQLIYLRFTAPRMDKEAFDAQVTQTKTILANQSLSPEFAFSKMMTETIYLNHPRRRQTTVETVDQWNLEKSLAFYKERFADASDFTFSFVGNVDTLTLKPLVEKYLATLPSIHRKETFRDNGGGPPKGIVEKVVRKGVEAKANTIIEFTGVCQYAPQTRLDFRALAELFQIQLNETLREKLGGAYSPNVSGGCGRLPRQEYSITVQFNSSPENVEKLSKSVFALIDSLKTHGPSASDVAKVKEQLIRAREVEIKQNGYWVGNILARDQAGEDIAGLLGPYDEMLKNLTPAQIQAAAKKYFDVTNYARFVLLPENGKTTP